MILTYFLIHTIVSFKCIQTHNFHQTLYGIRHLKMDMRLPLHIALNIQGVVIILQIGITCLEYLVFYQLYVITLCILRITVRQ
ncbi:MAG: hypothetical protein EBR82_49665 [Caulobacteraceae bacterium]|nr:hypothetical protein [Caulobacteraceae bacterium]